jgi:hypothetical protein
LSYQAPNEKLEMELKSYFNFIQEQEIHVDENSFSTLDLDRVKNFE